VKVMNGDKVWGPDGFFLSLLGCFESHGGFS
jgi:hypothetical protein